jgi:hypothetical protein
MIDDEGEEKKDIYNTEGFIAFIATFLLWLNSESMTFINAIFVFFLIWLCVWFLGLVYRNPLLALVIFVISGGCSE